MSLDFFVQLDDSLSHNPPRTSTLGRQFHFSFAELLVQALLEFLAVFHSGDAGDEACLYVTLIT